MFQYIFRRVIQFIPVFLGVTLALFLIANYLPGVDPIQLRMGEKSIDPALKARIMHELGLDRPWYVQYGDYVAHLAKGDLGTSLYNGRPVNDMIKETYPNTMRLAFAAILIEIVIGIGAGMISALKPYSLRDVTVTLITSILVSLPVFWLGLLLQYGFGIWLKKATGETFYLPVSGLRSPSFGMLTHLILPSITLASVSTAYAARIMRSQLLEVMGQDYIRTARAKGVGSRGVIWGHAVKNALIPVVTFVGLDLGGMLSGAVLTETVFNYPGVGHLLFRSISGRDFPVVFGCVTFILFAVMIVNLLVDISYAFLDPRIRYGGAAEG